MRTVVVVVTIMIMMMMMMMMIVVNRHTHSNWTKSNLKVLFCSFIIERNRRRECHFRTKTLSVIELNDSVRLLSQFFTFSHIKNIKIVWVVTVFANPARVCVFNLDDVYLAVNRNLTPLGKLIRGNYSLLWKCQWPFNAPHQGRRPAFDCFDYARMPR